MSTSATPVQLVDPATGLPYSAASSGSTSVNNFPSNQSVTVTNFPATQPVTVVDGGDVTQGAKADAAYAGSGSFSVIGILKGLYNALLLPTPAGTNVIGGVTIANGSNAAEGNTSDAAYTGGSTGSIVAILKGLFGLSTTYVGYNETAGNVTLGANATVSGTQRTPPVWANFFKAQCFTTQTGTFIIGHALAGGNFQPVRQATVSANATGDLYLPLAGAQNNVVAYFVNGGSTAGTIAIQTSFTRSSS